MRARLPDQNKICDVIIERVYTGLPYILIKSHTEINPLSKWQLFPKLMANQVNANVIKPPLH
jgi:hypothetical protein